MVDDDVRVPLSTDLEHEVAVLTGIPELAGWRDLGGSWSTNLAVTAPHFPDGLVIRIHQRFVTAARLAAEQQVRHELASAGLPTVPALPLLGGSSSARLDRGNLVEVEPYVVPAARMDTPERLVEGFRVLGQIHDALRTVEVAPDARTVLHANHLELDVAVQRAEAGAGRIRSWRIPELTAFADRLTVHVREVCARELPLAGGRRRQLVHGDFWDNNVLFDGHGDVTAVLDLGFMAERARIDDLALPIWYHLLGDTSSVGAKLDLVVAMLDAYDGGTTDPLTEAERLSLPLAVARQPSWLVGRWVVFEDEEARARGHAGTLAVPQPSSRSLPRSSTRWTVGSGCSRGRATRVPREPGSPDEISGRAADCDSGSQSSRLGLGECVTVVDPAAKHWV